MRYEKDIPAEQQATKKEAWFPTPDADPARTQDSRRAAAKRTNEAVGLKPLGLTRGDRLRKRAEFQLIYRNGVRVRGRYFVVFCMRGSSDRHRLGVTASRKVGNAVVRNRWKRRVRELFRQDRAELPDVPCDVVVNVHRTENAPAWDDLRAEYRASLHRLRRLIAPTRRS